MHRWRSQIHLKAIWLVGVVLAFCLSGCIEADVGVRFQGPSRGEIIQHLELSERLQSLSGESVQQWMRMVERQAATVGGTVQKESAQALTIKIPFTSSGDLEQKFNQFSQGIFNQDRLPDSVRFPLIESQLRVTHSNFLLLERDRLVYTVDLQSLGVVSSTGNVLVSPASLIRLQFALETPWGARSVVRSETLRPRSLQGHKKLIWSLIPGEQNTLEAVFWMPNSLGIGTVFILGLVILGTFLKYPQAGRGQVSQLMPSSESEISSL